MPIDFKKVRELNGAETSSISPQTGNLDFNKIRENAGVVKSSILPTNNQPQKVSIFDSSETDTTPWLEKHPTLNKVIFKPLGKLAGSYNKTDVGKFNTRASQTALDTISGMETEKQSTGNKIADTLASGVGLFGGMAISPGKGQSIGSGLLKVENSGRYLGTKLATNAPKLLQKPLAQKVLPTALGGALSGGVADGGYSLSKGSDAKTIAKNALIGMTAGVILDPAIENVLLPFAGRALAKLRSKPVNNAISGAVENIARTTDPDELARETAREMGVDWEYMNATQRDAIRKVVKRAQGEAVQSGLALNPAQEFTMRDMTPQDRYNSVIGKDKPLMIGAGKPQVKQPQLALPPAQDFTANEPYLFKTQIPKTNFEKPLVKLPTPKYTEKINSLEFEINKPKTPIDSRDYESVGDRAVKAIMYENPTIKPFYQEQAKSIKRELGDSVKGERYNTVDMYGERVFTGTRKFVSDTVENIQAITGATYKEIDKALDAIINDQGRENNALSKRIELIIDENLTSGYKTFDGIEVPANKEYILTKSVTEKKPTLKQGQLVLPSAQEFVMQGEPYSVKSQIPQTTFDKTPVPQSGFKTQIPRILRDKTPIPPTPYISKQTLELPKLKDKTPIPATPGNFPISPKLGNMQLPKQIKPLTPTLNSIGGIKKPLQPPELTKTAPIEPTSASSRIAFKKGKKSINEKLNDLYRATITNQANLDKFSKGLKTDANLNPAVMATTARKAGGTASYIVDDALVDMGGSKVGESLRKVMNVPKEQEHAFQEYLFHRHNIARMKAGKPVFGKDIPSENSYSAIAQFEKENPGFKAQADNFDQWWKIFSDEWAVKSGLVSKDLMTRLEQMYEHYVPTFRETTGQANKRINNYGRAAAAKVVQTAQGSDKQLIPLYESILTQVNKIVKAARQNEIYQGILDAVRKDQAKMKPWAELTEAGKREAQDIDRKILTDGIDGMAEVFDQALKVDPIKGYSLTVMENGKPVSLKISEGLYRDLMEFKKIPQSEVEKIVDFTRGHFTNPFKALITGYNPFFAVRNIFRDVPTAYIQGTENNPVGFLKNLFQAMKEIKGNTSTFQEYKALGGQGSNFFNVEQGLKPPGLLRKAGEKISAFNNLTETAPRFGEYLGTLKRESNTYAGKMQGLKNAAEVTTDFSRHGNIVKTADAFVPYLNPAVQGINKFYRSMKDPANIAKAIGTVTIPTMGLYAINQAVAKESYDKLDNRTKDTYYVIPDGSGKFLKVPKTREAGVLFGALFERLARLAQGQEDSFKGFGNTVATNFVVQNPVSQHVLAPLTWNLPRNKDFANRTIVPQSMLSDKRSPRYQYDEKTSEIAKK